MLSKAIDSLNNFFKTENQAQILASVFLNSMGGNSMKIRKIDETEQKEIEKYLMLDETMLYSLIPPYLPEYRGTLFTFNGQIEAGRKKFRAMQQQLYVIICKEWELCKKIDDDVSQDKYNLVIAIGDVISTIAVGIPPCLIASILVKMGLREFCNCPHKKK